VREVEAAAVLKAYARGEAELEELGRLGIQIDRVPGALHATVPGDLPVVHLPPADVATGLLRMYALGDDLQMWAAVMLAVDNIQFGIEDDSERESLLEGLWDAALTGSVAEPVVELARSLS
jgi:hypothetical protein